MQCHAYMDIPIDLICLYDIYVLTLSDGQKVYSYKLTKYLHDQFIPKLYN